MATADCGSVKVTDWPAPDQKRPLASVSTPLPVPTLTVPSRWHGGSEPESQLTPGTARPGGGACTGQRTVAVSRSHRRGHGRPGRARTGQRGSALAGPAAVGLFAPASGSQCHRDTKSTPGPGPGLGPTGMFYGLKRHQLSVWAARWGEKPRRVRPGSFLGRGLILRTMTPKRRAPEGYWQIKVIIERRPIGRGAVAGLAPAGELGRVSFRVAY